MMLLFLFAVLIIPVRPEYGIGFGRDRYDSCERKTAKCMTISNVTFMGTPLPYNSTTLDLIPVEDQVMVMDKLHILQGLQYIPKCWLYVQPFLCSLYMPKCSNDTVELPSYEQCKFVSTACRVVLNHTIWPDFIDCENQTLFSKTCKRDRIGIPSLGHTQRDQPKFNYTGQCLSPLIPTDNPLAVFEGVEGCGIPCSDPMYSQDEKKQNHSFIYWAFSICLCCNIFTVLTFFIDWESSNKYPALVIFWLNLCFMVCCFGWLSQFFPPIGRDVIVCRKDGTLRMNEPSGDSLWCVVVFIMIYYSTIAAMIWYVILTYMWYIKFKAYKTMQDRIDKNSAYFHIIAWLSAFIMTVLAGAFGEIDGNHVTGICFIGYNNHEHRIYFLLAPIMISVLVGGYFTLRALISLIKIKNSGPRSISNHNSAKLRSVIIRIGLFSFVLLFPIVITFYCHWYDFQHSWKWKQVFRDFMVCSITSKFAEMSECKMQSRPSAGKLQLHLLALPVTGIIMSTWIMTNTTIHSWKRFLKRVFKNEDEPMKLAKHKVIAQAFAQRKMINDNDGRCSITFHNTHQDPVGLNFDLNNDVGGDYYSSSWAAHLPKLVSRRGAICNEVSETSNRRNSTDSQISYFSLRRVAVESRRSSCDSQFALSISEVKAGFTPSRVNNSKRSKKVTARSKRRSERHKRNRKDFDKPIKHRRASTTSQESQMSIQFALCQIGLTSNNIPLPNMERRSGFDDGIISQNTENIIPYLLTPKALKNVYCSDENLSSENKSNSELYKDAKNENDKIHNDSEDDDSEPNEYDNMIKPTEPIERSKSKTSNKSSRSISRNDKRKFSDNQTKYKHESGNIFNHLLKKSKNDCEDNNKKSTRDLVSSISSYNQSLRSMQLDPSNAREIATQTFPVEEKRRSKATQISSKIHKKSKKPK